jgi:hypothetical protein
MPLYNFKVRFADAVATGQKCQTIRKRRRGDRDPKVGDTLYLYTGIRTKRARKLRQAITTRVRPIRIDARMQEGALQPLVTLDDDVLTIDDVRMLANKDGFRDAREFLSWFEEVHGLPFAGILIEWQ